MKSPTVDLPALHRLGRELLVAIGEDPDRPGLADTPRRFAEAWREFVEHDPGRFATTFDEPSSDGSIVVVSGMRVWSMCEHHLMPFWCDLAIGYKAAGRVLGLSKFARIAHAAAHRLQIQERLARDVADMIAIVADTPDVIVHARGQHLCMCMRGAKTPATMTTVAPLGCFAGDLGAVPRSEFLRLAGAAGPGA
jgi:GTP cyclohydrolase I